MKKTFLWPICAGLLIVITSLLLRLQGAKLFGQTQEMHLQNLKQLTFGGQNAEA